MAAYDDIYGYQVTNDGRDFVRDESGNYVKVFKSDELYETVMNVLQNKPLAEGSANSCYKSLYGLFSSFEDIFRNYNNEEKVYTIASLCEYSNPRTENDKTLKIIEIPMDLSSNSFSELESYLTNMNFGSVKTTTYDYKVSNIDYADDYLLETIPYSDKEFVDGCINAVYGGQKPNLVLGLLKDYTFSPGGNDLGMQQVLEMAVVEIDNNNVSVFTKSLRIAEKGNGFVYNILNNYNDSSYVVILDGDKSDKAINLDKVSYNETLINEISSAQTKSNDLSL